MVHKKIHNKVITVYPLQLTNGVTVYLETELESNKGSLQCEVNADDDSLQAMNLFGGEVYV